MLKLSELKLTTQTALRKYYAKLAKQNELEDVNDITIDTLGADFVQRQLQWRAKREYAVFTLGSLVAMLDNLSSVCQFEVAPAKIEGLINGTHGLFKLKGANPLYLEPEVICIRHAEGEDEYVIGGGRHRITSLYLSLSSIVGWEEFEIECRLYTVRSKAEALDYIEQSNGSRNMTSTEKGQLSLGMSLTSHDALAFFAESRSSDRNLTQSKELCAYGIAQLIHGLKHLKSGEPLGYNSATELAKKFQNKFIRLVNARLVDALPNAKKKPSINSLITTPLEAPTVDEDGEVIEDGGTVETTYLQEVGQTFAQRLTDGWEDIYFPMCANRKVVKGEEKVEYLLARALGQIADSIADELADEFSDTLIDQYNQYIAEEAETSAKKAEEAKARKKESQKNHAKAMLEMLEGEEGVDSAMLEKIKAIAGL